MTDEPTPLADMRVENALLRGALWLTANALKTYHDSPHFEIDDDEGIPKVEVIVLASTKAKAAEALERANKQLKEPERGAGR